MPIYGYQCKKCGASFQTLVRSGEEPVCPTCGSVELDQQLSLIASPARGGDNDAAPSCGAEGGACATCPAASMFN